jgi:hypothetical protein
MTITQLSDHPTCVRKEASTTLAHSPAIRAYDAVLANSPGRRAGKERATLGTRKKSHQHIAGFSENSLSPSMMGNL